MEYTKVGWCGLLYCFSRNAELMEIIGAVHEYQGLV
jgi:hypothetical protein